MAERVQLIFDAKDAASGVLRGLTSQLGMMGSVVEELTQKKISWGNVASLATQMVIEGLRESVNATLEYANEVRNLSAISGQNAEETSRFIQVLDDYKLSADDAMTATRALTSQGYAPSIDTLAALSDQYLQLNSAQEKNEFILENLGRSGLGWVEVLNKGSAAIKEQGAAVSEKLILDQKALDEARALEFAMDDWNDAVQEVKLSVGTELIPVMTTFLNRQMDLARASELAAEDGKHYTSILQLERDGYLALVEAERAATESTRENNIVTGEGVLTKQEAAAAAQALSREYTTLLSLTQSLARESENYTETMTRLQTEQNQVAAEIVTATAQYGSASEEVVALNLKYQDLGAQMQQTAAEHTAATNLIVYNNLIAKLSIDGLTDAEFELAQQAGVALGIFTQAQADQAVAINNLTTALANGQITMEQFNEAVSGGAVTIGESTETTSGSVERTKDDIAELNDTTKQVTDESGKAWQVYTQQVSGNLAQLIQATRDYIAVLQDIPTSVVTTIEQQYTTTGEAVTQGATVATAPTTGTIPGSSGFAAPSSGGEASRTQILNLFGLTTLQVVQNNTDIFSMM